MLILSQSHPPLLQSFLEPYVSKQIEFTYLILFTWLVTKKYKTYGVLNIFNGWTKIFQREKLVRHGATGIKRLLYLVVRKTKSRG